MRRSPVLAALGLLLASSLAWAPAARSEPTLFASWHAPYGDPGACDTLTGLCDNVGADTLYLSFDPGQAMPGFIALRGILAFHIASRDTFSQRWLFGGGTGNAYNIRLEAGPNDTFHTLQAWTSAAVGGVHFTHTAHHGFLNFLLAQSDKTPTPLESGKRYCFARLVIPHPPPIEGCYQPVCIELSSLKLTIGPKELLGTRGANRFISINSPDGAICREEKLKTKRPEVWTPGKR